MSPVPAPTPSEIRYRRLAVDIESTRPDAVLERRVSTKESNGVWLVIPLHTDESTWEQVCIAPCQGVDLDRYSTYRVAAGNHISASRSFTLPQGGDSTHLKLDAGDLRAHRAGVFVSSVGMASLIVGVALLSAAPSVDDPAKAHDWRIAGWTTGFAGIALLAVGIPLALLTNTTVYADNDRRMATAPSKPRFTGDGFTF
jgi:hypothetical protein